MMMANPDTAARLQAAIDRLWKAGYIRADGSFRQVPKVTPSKTTRATKAKLINPDSDPRIWRQEANKQAQALDAKLTPREKNLLGIFEFHHKRPLSQNAWLLYGLPPEEMAKARAYSIQRQRPGGDVILNQQIAFGNIHKLAHETIDRGAGPMQARAGKSIEKLLDPGMDVQDFILTKTFAERKLQFLDFMM